MALPVKANNTCDIYRAGVSPPSSPSVAAVACYVKPAYVAGKESAEGAAGMPFTHVMLVGDTVDIRDAYTGNGAETAADTVYIPAGTTTTRFFVRFIEMVGFGTPLQHKKVYLDRRAPTWPTDNL